MQCWKTSIERSKGFGVVWFSAVGGVEGFGIDGFPDLKRGDLLEI